MKGRWEDYQKAKGGTTDEAEGGEDGKGQQNPFFMLVKAGGHETPYLVKNNRSGQQNSGGEG